MPVITRRASRPILFLLAALLLAGCALPASPAPTSSAPATTAPTSSVSEPAAPFVTVDLRQALNTPRPAAPPDDAPVDLLEADEYPRAASQLPTIRYDDLPREAHETLLLIEEDGPFPYKQDGQTFQNREGILPKRPQGYYAEYTVDTPGSDDRGARRIVAGDAGERYYTDDHYDSFSRVIR